VRGSYRAIVGLVASLALLATAAPASAEPAIALTAGDQLLSFDTSSPTSVTTIPVTGLGAGESLRGIDVRQADGRLYGSTVATGSLSNSIIRTYTIDPATGAATLVGAIAAGLAGAGDVETGYDINPSAPSPPGDRIRYVNTNNENARLNPNNGTLAGNDTDLNGFPAPAVIGAAFSPNTTGGVARATLYAINRANSSLSVLGGGLALPSPNTGLVTLTAALGLTLAPTNDAGFDVSPGGTAFAALTDNADGLTRLYTINLETGATNVAAPIDLIGTGTTAIRSLAILTPQPTPPPDTKAPKALLDTKQQNKIKRALKSKLTASFSCDEACTAVAALVARKKQIATASASLAAANVGSLVLAPTKAGRKALKKAKRSRSGELKTKLEVNFADAAGNTASLSRKILLAG
jgi:hypothetical protein